MHIYLNATTSLPSTVTRNVYIISDITYTICLSIEYFCACATSFLFVQRRAGVCTRYTVWSLTNNLCRRPPTPTC